MTVFLSSSSSPRSSATFITPSQKFTILRIQIIGIVVILHKMTLSSFAKIE